jgi:hypothetical protein
MRAFQKASKKFETEEGVLTRLEWRNGRIVASQFDEAELEIVTREHVEIR